MATKWTGGKWCRTNQRPVNDSHQWRRAMQKSNQQDQQGNKKTAGYILLVNPSNTSMFLEVFASATTFIRSKWSTGISSPPEDVALMYPSCNWTSHFPRQCTAIWAATAAWARWWLSYLDYDDHFVFFWEIMRLMDINYLLSFTVYRTCSFSPSAAERPTGVLEGPLLVASCPCKVCKRSVTCWGVPPSAEA